MLTLIHGLRFSCQNLTRDSDHHDQIRIFWGMLPLTCLFLHLFQSISHLKRLFFKFKPLFFDYKYIVFVAVLGKRFFEVGIPPITDCEILTVLKHFLISKSWVLIQSSEIPRRLAVSARCSYKGAKEFLIGKSSSK